MALSNGIERLLRLVSGKNKVPSQLDGVITYSRTIIGAALLATLSGCVTNTNFPTTQPGKQGCGDSATFDGEALPSPDPLTKFTNIHISKGEIQHKAISVKEGYRYTACLEPSTTPGDPDLYGSFGFPPTPEQHEKKSTNSGEGDDHLPKMDCITFEPPCNGTYHLGIFGKENSTTDLWAVGTPLRYVPAGFEEGILWPLKNCRFATSEEYGSFNSPWGNELPENNPFYPGFKGRLHGGFDGVCSPGEEIKAAAKPGKIVARVVKNGQLSNPGDYPNWGDYTVIEYISLKSGKIVSIAYDHITPGSALPEGTEITDEITIGTVFEMEVRGEKPHLHITACGGMYEDCKSEGRSPGHKPQRGALPYDEFPGLYFKWFDTSPNKNPGIYYY